MIRAQILISVFITISFAFLTGIVFPITVWGIAKLAFPDQANGSFQKHQGKIVGSNLVGQTFSAAKYFHSRPSAAGSGYDASASGGTNLGPTSKKLFAGLADDPATADVDESYLGVEMLARIYREENGLAPNASVPVDAVTRSGSGLDPHISLLNATLQAPRVARERGLRQEEVLAIIQNATEERFLGIFGEPRVNVLRLNIVLDGLTIASHNV